MMCRSRSAARAAACTATDGGTVTRAVDRPVATLGETMVLFDWNGAIVVDADRARAALNAVLARRGLPVLGETEFSLRFRLPLTQLFGRLGIPATDRAAAEQEWNAEMADTHAHLREGATACLSALSKAGAWLGVVSAASAAAVRFDQRSLAVPSVWNSVESSVTDKFELLLRHRPTRPNAFFVGESADDLRCASAAGYTPIGVTDAHASAAALRAAGASHVIGALDELLTIVV
ncbi:HAD family hydrolase [Herbiconiux daphne]|uniref:HAD hydrolase-like protein n=1 Tax=Herbiconiux daphne TaxID=2970914 RepID=A0ABT2GZT9_9MICO|nr:HAD hydrolase-like protein [Herbiconiux daphne]MCS5732209.1 HAD hydrolase-like protein [Herbiconiux daphne]